MKIRSRGKIVVGLAAGVIGLMFSGGTEAAVIAGTGPTSTWTAADWGNPASPGGAIGENVTVLNSGGTLNNNWYLNTVTLSLFQRFPGGDPVDVKVYLIPGTQVNNASYVDNSASAVASLTIPFADVNSAPLYGTPTTYAFTSFSDPNGVITPGSYYLEFQTPGANWILYGHRDGGTNTYAGGDDWYQAGASIGVNAGYNTYFLLDGDPVNIVPEPLSLALFGLAGMALLRNPRRHT